MNKVIGILAHVDAGKTTFCEQLLYRTNSIRQMGRVDHKDTHLDYNEIEKNRGITIFSDIGNFEYNGDKYFIIDTPGHIDFSPQMERAIHVMDYAIVVLDGTSKISGHTKTIWKLLELNNIPAFIFINKVDREVYSKEKILSEIKKELCDDIILINNIESLKDEEIEEIAAYDTKLLDDFCSEKYSYEAWINELKNLIRNRKVIIASEGTALRGDGIDSFIKTLHKLTFVKESNQDKFKGKVFKIKYDEKGNKIVFIKVLSGSIKVKGSISVNIDGEEISEKINEIRIYNGIKFKRVNEALTNEIVGIIGPKNLKLGDTIGFMEENDYKMVSTLTSKVIYDKNINKKEIIEIFKILEEEEGSLKAKWNEETEELNINIMGEIGLEVLKEIVKERFKIDIEFGEPEIIYKETIKGESMGYGHFEPLKHYAEVMIKVKEGERGKGIIFKDESSRECLSSGTSNLIKKHIFERDHRGVLTGSTITDLEITLLDGREHIKHTSGGDFREATKRALRCALENANNILLEPYYKYHIKVKEEQIKSIISDIGKMKGEFNPVVYENGYAFIEGLAPVKTFMNYKIEFRGKTKGEGSINTIFHSYKECHNFEEVVKTKDYKDNADKEYTSTSIFCSKGQSFLVQCKNVKEYMHCLK